MLIPVAVSVGVGAWKAHAKTRLIACPHVGDSIEVEGQAVTCERVHITSGTVYVEQTIRFASADEAASYFKKG